MVLQMYLEGKLIDSVFVSGDSFSKLHLLQQRMEDKHCDILDLSQSEPQFFVEGINSAMNGNFLEMPKTSKQN